MTQQVVLDRKEVHVVAMGSGIRGEKGDPGGVTQDVLNAITDLQARVQALEGSANYIHYQSVSAAVWVVNHNLGKYPSVTIVDSALTEVEGEVLHNSDLQCVLTFSAPFSGRAFLN